MRTWSIGLSPLRADQATWHGTARLRMVSYRSRGLVPRLGVWKKCTTRPTHARAAEGGGGAWAWYIVYFRAAMWRRAWHGDAHASDVIVTTYLSYISTSTSSPVGSLTFFRRFLRYCATQQQIPAFAHGPTLCMFPSANMIHTAARLSGLVKHVSIRFKDPDHKEKIGNT
jgi:hypothetical protein